MKDLTFLPNRERSRSDTAQMRPEQGKGAAQYQALNPVSDTTTLES